MIHFVYKWHSTLSIFLSPIHFPVHTVNDILQFPLTPGCLCALSKGSWGGFFVAVAVATVVICSSNLKGPEDWTGELLYWHNSPFHTGTVGSLCKGALELKHHALRICTPSSHSFFFFFFKERREEGLKKAAKISWAKGNTDEEDHVICNWNQRCLSIQTHIHARTFPKSCHCWHELLLNVQLHTDFCFSIYMA